jgi:hypothetical protein
MRYVYDFKTLGVCSLVRSLPVLYASAPFRHRRVTASSPASVRCAPGHGPLQSKILPPLSDVEEEREHINITPWPVSASELYRPGDTSSIRRTSTLGIFIFCIKYAVCSRKAAVKIRMMTSLMKILYLSASSCDTMASVPRKITGCDIQAYQKCLFILIQT